MSVWRIGWAAVKANAVPMAVLWCLAAATVAAYYLVPDVAAVYAFPRPLQIQVSGFATAFWVLMCLKIGALSRPATIGAE